MYTYVYLDVMTEMLYSVAVRELLLLLDGPHRHLLARPGPLRPLEGTGVPRSLTPPTPGDHHRALDTNLL